MRKNFSKKQIFFGHKQFTVIYALVIVKQYEKKIRYYTKQHTTKQHSTLQHNKIKNDAIQPKKRNKAIQKNIKQYNTKR